MDRRRTVWLTTTAARTARPATSLATSGMMRNAAAAISAIRSTVSVGTNRQPIMPALIATIAVAVTWTSATHSEPSWRRSGSRSTGSYANRYGTISPDEAMLNAARQVRFGSDFAVLARANGVIAVGGVMSARIP